jgi:hypothetical protein
MTTAMRPGFCACGCRKPFLIGEEIVRIASGWARAACVAPPTSAGPEASPAEVREILARARFVRDTAEAADRLRAARARRVAGGAF